MAIIIPNEHVSIVGVIRFIVEASLSLEGEENTQAAESND